MSNQEFDVPAGKANESTQALGGLTTGRQLAAAREALGWSTDRVAAQLNLAIRQVEAIEHDDYAALPGVSITRGFIRAYAKLLRIDAAPLLSGVPGNAGGVNASIMPPKTLSMPFPHTRLPSMTDRAKPGKKALSMMGLVLFLIGSGWWAYQQGMLRSLIDSAKVIADRSKAKTSEAAAPIAAPAATSPAAEAATASTVTSTITEMVATPDVLQTVTTDSDVNDATPSLPVKDAVITSVAEVPPPVSVPSADEHNSLVLNVRADSWIEIKRTDNHILFSGVVKAGKAENFELNGPVSLVVGNAAGVDVTFRGKPLETKTKSSNNVARLSLK